MFFCKIRLVVFSEPIANKRLFGCTNVKGTVDSKSKPGAGSVKNLSPTLLTDKLLKFDY